MRGSVQKKGDVYYIVFDYGRNSSTGKRLQKWITTGTKKKKEAEARLAEMMKEINTGTYVEPSKMTLGDYLDNWLETVIRLQTRPSTFINYSYIVNDYIKPEFGSLPIAQLAPLHIQNFLYKLIKSGQKPSSVVKIFAVLRSACNKAIKQRILVNSPCAAVEPPEVEKYKASILTPNQLRELFDAVEDTYLNLPIVIAATCGIRRGEVCGLRWQDVDFEKKTLCIRNSLNWNSGKLKLVPVKSNSSERLVKLAEVTITALKKEKARQAEFKLRSGGLYEDRDFCWTWDDGRPHDPYLLYKKFKKLLAQVGLPVVRFHDLRHSHATTLLLDGVPVKVISERLGHSSTTITQEIYSHVLPEMQQQAADTIDKLFAKASLC